MNYRHTDKHTGTLSTWLSIRFHSKNVRIPGCELMALGSAAIFTFFSFIACRVGVRAYGFIFTCNEQPTVLIALSDIPALNAPNPYPPCHLHCSKVRNQRLTRHLKMKSEYKGKEVVCQEGEAVHLLSNVL